MTDVDAIGDLVGGAAVARAVEPKAGELSEGHTAEHACLNCGSELVGDFCHRCGQHAHVHRTVGAFFHDLAHGVLHFEGKIWRTLPLLVWKPGELTRRYIDGQRASFVSPIALFLFSVFLMFAVVSATGNVNPSLGASRDLQTAEKEARTEIAALVKAKASANGDREKVAKLDEEIADARDDLALIQDLKQRGITEATFSRSKMTVNSKVPWVEEAYHRAKQNPELLLYKLKSNSYKWSWAIIPLSVPFLWLMFPFSRRFRLYDHVVFVTYSLCFMTLAVAVGTLISAVGLPQVAVALPFVPPIHMYRQLRGAYGVGRFGAIWRTAVLLMAAIVVLSLFIILMVGLGLQH